MSDYIDRDEVLKLVEPDARPFLAERIMALPSADVVERITAKEVREEDDYWRCSNCDCSLSATMYVTKDRHLILHPNYCPNCGADMRQKDGD